MISAKFLWGNVLSWRKATNRFKKFKFWNFWERPLYEISEYAFKFIFCLKWHTLGTFLKTSAIQTIMGILENYIWFIHFAIVHDCKHGQSLPYKFNRYRAGDMHEACRQLISDNWNALLLLWRVGQRTGVRNFCAGMATWSDVTLYRRVSLAACLRHFKVMKVMWRYPIQDLPAFLVTLLFPPFNTRMLTTPKCKCPPPPPVWINFVTCQTISYISIVRTELDSITTLFKSKIQQT